MLMMLAAGRLAGLARVIACRRCIPQGITRYHHHGFCDVHGDGVVMGAVMIIRTHLRIGITATTMNTLTMAMVTATVVAVMSRIRTVKLVIPNDA